MAVSLAGLTGSSLVCVPSARPDRVAEPGGVLGVVLAVDQHQRSPLVVLDDVRQAVEILQGKKMLHVNG